jgi:pyrroloquinoline quinone biosynthesis protein D
MSTQQTPVKIEARSNPSLRPHARLRHDAARDRWVILAPERIFEPDAIAVAVLRLCDGTRSVEDIAVELGRIYDADHAQILGDIIPTLQDLADKHVIWIKSPDA